MRKPAPLRELVIGVIGGMGPLATADFLAKLTLATPVETEQDHLRLLIDSNPNIPDMQALATTLANAGAQWLIPACTEVPLVLRAGHAGLPMIDATSTLARRCLRYARGIEMIPPTP